MGGNLTSMLRTHFGFNAFRPGQAEAIQSLLSGHHTFAIMPTGAGKSLIYQLTALHLSEPTVVISPLIALMKDQVDSLERRGISCTYINSSLPRNEQVRRIKAMAAGTYRLVYIAPERLRSTSFMQALRQMKIGLLAIDEAHCISHWGHDFRPDYLHIAAASEEIGNPLIIALTATATPQVQDDVVRLLDLQFVKKITTGFNRPNLLFEVRYTLDVQAKLKAVRDLLANLHGGTAIIYAGTRRDAEEVADFVCTVCKTQADYYHAGMDSKRRDYIQNRFLAGKLPVVAATNAFGMGIDRPDVRMVLHYSLPGTLEAYYQEAGRAGRDGKAAQAVLLYAPDDRALQEWFIENDTPRFTDLRALFDAIKTSGKTEIAMTHGDLSLATGLPEVKIRLGLAQLETVGSIRRLGDTGTQMMLNVGAWNQASVQETFALNEKRLHYRRNQLTRMVAYAESNDCRRRILLDHFGDRSTFEVERCCDNCLSSKSAAPQKSPEEIASLSQAEQIALIILESIRILEWGIGREKLAQILKGSRAREILKFDYDQNRYYGRLVHYRLFEIKELIEQLATQGYLKVIGGTRPILQLTPKGKTALRARASISIHLPGDDSQRITVIRRLNKETGSFETVSNTSRSGSDTQEHIQRVAALGESRSPSAVPELIKALEDSDGNIRRLAASALGKIGDQEGVRPLMQLLEGEKKPQVRQYAVKALGKIGDPQAKTLLEKIASDNEERDYTQKAARVALKQLSGKTETQAHRDFRIKKAGAEQQPAKDSDEIADYLTRSHPRPLPGSWDTGWALDFHSAFRGDRWCRSRIGELVYCLKYRYQLAVLQPIVKEVVAFCDVHPELVDVDAFVPILPSTLRAIDPIKAVAETLGRKLQRPVRPVLEKTRSTSPQKEMHTLAQKRKNVAGAFCVKGDVKGQRLLVLDDLFDSGATLEEATQVLRRAGAIYICVLTLTRTIHADL